MTTETFVERARQLNGDKYDYSAVKYIHSRIKVCIICHTHGEFWQNPTGHLHGYGCTECARIKSKKKIYGIGINDYNGFVRVKREFLTSYKYWAGMLMRCYSESIHKKRPRYKDCTVCEEWKLFSNFKKWFDENYIEGYQLDKDILFKDNKIYSPETCCFVPTEINNLFEKSNRSRGKYPIGVSFSKSSKDFESYIRADGKRVHLGHYSAPEEAFNVYKLAKEAYISRMAEEYYGKVLIKENVYNAMLNYKVEITD